MPTIISRALPYWLATIDTRKMRKDDERRREILNYQREALWAFDSWMQPKAKQVIKPMPPAKEASLEEWQDYYQQMAVWMDRRRTEGKK
jgi:hypothetical protein